MAHEPLAAQHAPTSCGQGLEEHAPPKAQTPPTLVQFACVGVVQVLSKAQQTPAGWAHALLAAVQGAPKVQAPSQSACLVYVHEPFTKQQRPPRPNAPPFRSM